MSAVGGTNLQACKRCVSQQRVEYRSLVSVDGVVVPGAVVPGEVQRQTRRRPGGLALRRSFLFPSGVAQRPLRKRKRQRTLLWDEGFDCCCWCEVTMKHDGSKGVGEACAVRDVEELGWPKL